MHDLGAVLGCGNGTACLLTHHLISGIRIRLRRVNRALVFYHRRSDEDHQLASGIGGVLFASGVSVSPLQSAQDKSVATTDSDRGGTPARRNFGNFEIGPIVSAT